MGESLFGKLKSVLSRQKKSEISTTSIADNGSGIDLSRIGMTHPQEMHVQPDMPQPEQPMPAHADPVSGHVGADPSAQIPVNIQFLAELPLQHCAEEIVNVSKRASNCVEAVAQADGNDSWSVAITLAMPPIPQDIHMVESTLNMWVAKLGGTTKGWGLMQQGAAA